jgi:uncharacterized protein (DUF983 family)
MTTRPAPSETPAARRDTGLAIRRGLALRCPACGKGHILAGYLKPADQCDVCGQNFQDIRADDGPAWATILLVGHLTAPSFFLFHRPGGASIVALIVVCVLVVGLTLAILPRAKGLFIGAIWANRAGDATPDPVRNGSG